VLGLSLRAAGGVSVFVAGDLGLILTSNDWHVPGPRRFLPGAQIGVSLH
jgi:hypothetical protein